MYLIDESIDEIKACFRERENFEGTDGGMIWEDVSKCNFENAQFMQYNLDRPIDFIELLKKMWENVEILGDEELIRFFVASAFRQTINR